RARATLFLRYDHTHRIGQLADRLRKAGAGVLHHELDGAAMCATTEAVIELLGGTYGEGWRLFAVKRAQSKQVRPGLAHLHILSHHICHVDAVEEALDKGIGDHGRPNTT